jgi:hypothetical protein
MDINFFTLSEKILIELMEFNIIIIIIIIIIFLPLVLACNLSLFF